MKFIFIAFTVTFLSSCASIMRDENVESVQEKHRVGIEAGKPTDVVETTRTSERTQDKTSAGVDVLAGVKALMDAKNGDIMAAIAQFKPQDLSPMVSMFGERLDKFGSQISATKPQGTDQLTLIAGSLATIMTGYGAMKHVENRKIIKEKESLHREKVDLALRVPAPTTDSYHPQETGIK